IFHLFDETFTYDHRTMNTELPVRSAVLKHRTGGLVVRWVTTSEYLLLYVFAFFLRNFRSFCGTPVFIFAAFETLISVFFAMLIHGEYRELILPRVAVDSVVRARKPVQ
ncbi:hypothetical protein P280DRAFT_411302, partial [Massarina eburnea CBS 473.64]